MKIVVICWLHRIILDENLSWKVHVAMVIGKLSKINDILNRLKFIYPAQVLLTIYKSLFVPHINYRSLVWGQNCDSVCKLQKKVIRTITHRELFPSHIPSHF